MTALTIRRNREWGERRHVENVPAGEAHFADVALWLWARCRKSATCGRPRIIPDALIPAVVDMRTSPVDVGLSPDATSSGLSPCVNNGDCPSSYCVPSPDGDRVCTTLCRGRRCPQDWSCLPVANTRPDTVFICIADRQVQCLGCAQDAVTVVPLVTAVYQWVVLSAASRTAHPRVSRRPQLRGYDGRRREHTALLPGHRLLCRVCRRRWRWFRKHRRLPGR